MTITNESNLDTIFNNKTLMITGGTGSFVCVFTKRVALKRGNR